NPAARASHGGRHPAAAARTAAGRPTPPSRIRCRAQCSSRSAATCGRWSLPSASLSWSQAGAVVGYSSCAAVAVSWPGTLYDEGMLLFQPLPQARVLTGVRFLVALDHLHRDERSLLRVDTHVVEGNDVRVFELAVDRRFLDEAGVLVWVLIVEHVLDGDFAP